MRIVPAFSVHLCILFATTLISAQGGRPCSVIDGERDTLYIEFEKTVDNLPKGEWKKESHVILRLKNNSTCSIELSSADVSSFYEPLPPKPTAAQLIEHIKNPKTKNISDGDFISELVYYVDIVFGSEVTVFTNNTGGDYFFGFNLNGGSSIQFGVPFKDIRENKLVLIPFKFAWEDENRSKFRRTGDTAHFVQFSYRDLPDEVRKKIKK